MRTRLDLLLALAAVRGIRVVPAEPGPEFLVVPFACDLRPGPCSSCAVGVCPHGEHPGRSGLAEAPKFWRPKSKIKIKKGVSRSGGSGLVSVTMECPLCVWQITTPDPESAFAALSRHQQAKHPESQS